jgi:hypothetical protein
VRSSSRSAASRGPRGDAHVSGSSSASRTLRRRDRSSAALATMRCSHAPNACSGRKAVEGAEGVQEALLHRVLRVLVREDDRARHRVGAPLVAADEHRERLRVAGLRGEHDLALGGEVVGRRRRAR